MADTATIVVEVPLALADELAASTQEFLAELLQRGLRQERIERALARYQRGAMSFAAAAEAGTGQAEFARQAYVRGLEPPFDPAMVAEELQ